MTGETAAAGWRAGAARVCITPSHPRVWMAGYGTRDAPSDGKVHDLHARAVALEDAAGRRALLVSVEVVGVTEEMLARVRRLAGAEPHRVAAAAVRVVATHTHSGPALAGQAWGCSGNSMPGGEAADIAKVTEEVLERVDDAAAAALAALRPARVSAARTSTDFATNRRVNVEAELAAAGPGVDRASLKGPADHAVDCLFVHDAASGAPVAAAFGYACHNTVLNGQQLCGDWAGFAALELERAHPGIAALFVTGCAADQNPLPRRSVALAERYGGAAAGAVSALLKARGAAAELPAELLCRDGAIELPYATPPTEAELQQQAADPDTLCKSLVPDGYDAEKAAALNNSTAGGLGGIVTGSRRRWAEGQLRVLRRDGALPRALPGYPVSVWRLGGAAGLLSVALGGVAAA